MLTLIIVIILVALVFDFLNGFHDAANSIATIVCTRVLTPAQAVMWAAFFNFIAAFVFGTRVADRVGKGMIDTEAVDIYVVLAGLLGAIIWNIITWWLALPTSSSHALLSGYAGAAIAKGGMGVLILPGWIPVLLFIVLSPIIGFVLAYINVIITSYLFRNARPRKVDSLFRRLQLVSAGLYSLGHGTNDAQKTMGIIVALLVAAGPQYAAWTEGGLHLFGRQHEIALWIILSCNGAIALGTMFGGWRIVKTMGDRITRLQPIGGFCAETAGAMTLIGTAINGIPISTTHAITGAILGVGSAHNPKSVRWAWGERIVMAWVLTLPCSAFIAAIAYLLIHGFLLIITGGGEIPHPSPM
ncbi:MAG TPA: inorganic phosphate transporter [Phycisphaerae bacterium]|jgi:PiT family inorganic phosphate transporter|nr:inorganic phosphate transporter [Phycisphaerae bacterium]HOB74796.1 inorganic phosphate transporter [Phycisphaerae bacterium]HOJ54369.1 inorganic phosphate transporter [Phycisphaerae bacterium]HOL26840.1 inorganic phosphate transporter [Phycisphaerae bacterium]HPP20001.1 inorganic phosphate transporter [Phycisphaerae bacterium]